MTLLTLTLALVALLFALAATVVRRVPDGQVYSLYRGGSIRLLQPGVHVVLPGLERLGHRIDLGGRVLRLAPAPASMLQATVYWQVLEPERADAVNDRAEQLIGSRALALLGEQSAAPESPRALSGQLKLALNAALREHGVMVTRVELASA